MNLIIESLFCMPRIFCQFIFLAGEWVHFFRIFCQLVPVSSLADLNHNSPLGCLCSPVFISWLEQTLQQDSCFVPEIFEMQSKTRSYGCNLFINCSNTNRQILSQIKNRIQEHSLRCLMLFFSACNSVGYWEELCREASWVSDYTSAS